MNGTIFDIKKFAIHDGPGIRTTVFFMGCPLNCRWCHNPEGRQKDDAAVIIEPDSLNINWFKKNELLGRIISVETLMTEIKKDTVFYNQSGGGVTFSGGEPMMQVDFLYELLRKCRKSKIHTAMDTSGYAPVDEFEKVVELVDLFLYDLKLMDNKAHTEYTGVSNNLILDNLTYLLEKGAKVNIRIPLVPDVTDTDENLDGIIQYLRKLQYTALISLLPYNLLGEDKCRRFDMAGRREHYEPQTDDKIDRIESRFVSRGYKVKIGG